MREFLYYLELKSVNSDSAHSKNFNKAMRNLFTFLINIISKVNKHFGKYKSYSTFDFIWEHWRCERFTIQKRRRVTANAPILKGDGKSREIIERAWHSWAPRCDTSLSRSLFRSVIHQYSRLIHFSSLTSHCGSRVVDVLHKLNNS